MLLLWYVAFGVYNNNNRDFMDDCTSSFGGVVQFKVALLSSFEVGYPMDRGVAPKSGSVCLSKRGVVYPKG